MARNKLIDLNNHLMASLERLEDEDLTKEELETEIKRSKAIEGIAKQVINNANLTFNALKLTASGGYKPGAFDELTGVKSQKTLENE